MNQLPSKSHEEPAKPSTLRVVWWLLAAAVVWGTILGIGALLKDVRRGLIVFGFLFLFALFWGLLLMLMQKRRNHPKEPAHEDTVNKSRPSK